MRWTSSRGMQQTAHCGRRRRGRRYRRSRLAAGLPALSRHDSDELPPRRPVSPRSSGARRERSDHDQRYRHWGASAPQIEGIHLHFCAGRDPHSQLLRLAGRLSRPAMAVDLRLHSAAQIALAANALPNSVSTVASLVRNLAPSSSATAADRRSANRRAASGVPTNARPAVISFSKLSLPCS
jgi:hypothetical protein